MPAFNGITAVEVGDGARHFKEWLQPKPEDSVSCGCLYALICIILLETIAPEHEAIVNNLMAEGTIRLIPQTHYCEINEDVWRALDREARKNLTLFVGIHITKKRVIQLIG